MTNLRIVLLATTALTVTQIATSASHAQNAPLVVAQAREELGPDGKPKAPPKGAPPPAAKPPTPPAPPPAAAPPPRPVPPPAPPPAAAPPPRPAPPPAPPAAAPPPRPTPPPAPPPAAAPKPPAPPAAAPPPRPTPPPAAAPPARPTPTPPPAAAPPARTPPPPAATTTPAPTASPPAAGSTTTTPPGAPPRPGTGAPPAGTKRVPGAPGAAPTATPTATPSPTTPPAAATPSTPPAGAAPTAPSRPGATTPPAAGGATTTPPGGQPPRPGQPPGAPPAAGTTPPAGAPPAAGTTPPAGAPPSAGAPTPGQQGRPVIPPAPPAGAPAPSTVPGSAAATAPPGRSQNAPPTVAPAFRAAPTVTTQLPSAPPPRRENMTPLAIGAGVVAGAVVGATIANMHSQRRETIEGGRTIYTEPDRIIIRDPSGQQYVRGNDLYRFRYGARDIQTETVGGETRTVVIRPDGSRIITVVGNDGRLLRRIRRDERGREVIIIDNSYRDPRAVGGFYVDLPPPVVNMPYDRYIVSADEATPEVIYDTMVAPPVQRIDRRYSLDEIRYSPNVRMQMPSIDVNSINFATGSWEIPPDQAARLQAIADGLNRAIQANPREVFLIEGHTDRVGSDIDNLSLSDRRAESAATLLTQQFGVPAENLTSQGYGEQYPKEQTDGPSEINRRVTVRRITPLLNGGQASLPPPPPGTAPPRR
ncbi:OmpA family protein [Bradyrhizobium sp. AUGA SZCCT0177]|uniref:OmpA family protein n=1 Tax=Bradyrhizobium sp. AUGA SZCCT0177 TaxID=2807665 RepID=UPI001BA54051|nr:OmpA family protein [Bradyrhizobium sp. AUGA SZCCT0177]MBR1285852.1 OmpA family protein [Bradyrhizobium sp. AUGA SZCCT0177]